MGFTTIVEINNDFLDDIKKDPKKFVDQLNLAISGTPPYFPRGWNIAAVIHRDSLDGYYKFKKKNHWA
jgi:hypothetical protein